MYVEFNSLMSLNITLVLHYCDLPFYGSIRLESFTLLPLSEK
jgi:hypothetical protein